MNSCEKIISAYSVFLRFVKSMEMNMHPFDNHDVLLEALRKGEEKAFEYLFDRYYEGLLNYAGQYCSGDGAGS